MIRLRTRMSSAADLVGSSISRGRAWASSPISMSRSMIGVVLGVWWWLDLRCSEVGG